MPRFSQSFRPAPVMSDETVALVRRASDAARWLSDRERDIGSSLVGGLKSGRKLSEKQMALLMDLIRRGEARGAAKAGG